MAGLYIHIPFCAQRCAYCDFHKSTDLSLRGGLIAALEREMERRRGAIPGGRLSTVYVGGGTPTVFAPEELQRLLDRAAVMWDCSGLLETTLEANPEDLTEDYLRRLSSTGFDRLSIGIQSFDDGLLRLMNRRHTSSRAVEAVEGARRAGFGNISIDLIYGIPGMSRAQWEHSLSAATALGVEHISAYHLTIEPGTEFGRMAAAGRLAAVDEAESEWQYETLRRFLVGVGYEHYEISNFARPDFRAVHNSSYWSGESYLGVGPSAHSYDGARRRSWVDADTDAYIKGGNPVCGSEELTEGELYDEFVMLSLRRAEGVDLAELERRFGSGRAEDFRRRAERFTASGRMAEKDSRIFIRAEDFLLSDYITRRLLAPG